MWSWDIYCYHVGLTYALSFYNKTSYSGLEIHIANSYANALLQIMHYTPLIRNLTLQHTATACVSETCLLCELGFLFDMLQKAEGSICQATNLLKALSHQPQGKLSQVMNVGSSVMLTPSKLLLWVSWRKNSTAPL